MKKKLILVITSFAILILILVIVQSCVITDPTDPVVQLYEAFMNRDCDRVGELSKYDQPELSVASCKEHLGEITSYRIIGVEGREGIPGLIEWAAVKTRLEFTDRPPSEGKRFVRRQFFRGWELTEGTR